MWADFMKAGRAPKPYARRVGIDEPAVVLFSGGTSALPKGIELSSANFNALAVSMQAITGLTAGKACSPSAPSSTASGSDCACTPR